MRGSEIKHCKDEVVKIMNASSIVLGPTSIKLQLNERNESLTVNNTIYDRIFHLANNVFKQTVCLITGSRFAFVDGFIRGMKNLMSQALCM